MLDYYQRFAFSLIPRGGFDIKPKRREYCSKHYIYNARCIIFITQFESNLCVTFSLNDTQTIWHNIFCLKDPTESM